jgi:hypothetical protein
VNLDEMWRENRRNMCARWFIPIEAFEQLDAAIHNLFDTCSDEGDDRIFDRIMAEYFEDWLG